METNPTTETATVTTRSVGIRYGMILAAISVAYFLILTLTGVSITEGPARWASFLFYLVVIFLAHKNFKDTGDGFMSFGQGMGITFWLGLISTSIYSVFFYIYIKFIDASFVQMIKDKQMEDMQNRGMSDEQIEQAMRIASTFMSPEIMFLFGLVVGIIFILICGLVVSAITQKKNPQTEIA